MSAWNPARLNATEIALTRQDDYYYRTYNPPPEPSLFEKAWHRNEIVLAKNAIMMSTIDILENSSLPTNGVLLGLFRHLAHYHQIRSYFEVQLANKIEACRE